MNITVLGADILERLRAFAIEEEVGKGQLLFEQGDAMLDLLVVLEGRLELYEQRQNGVVAVVHSLCSGAFTGELDVLDRRRSLLSCRAARKTRILRVGRDRLQTLFREDGELAERIILECVGRRNALVANGQCGAIVVGSSRAADTMRILQFLTRNGHPHRFIDSESNPEASSLIGLLECEPSDLPAVFLPHQVLCRNPSNRHLADLLGLANDRFDSQNYDVAIVGAGPAGLAAAVYASSEGLRTVVVECQATGGQAATSSKIENYLGFPTGISGQELASRAAVQAQRFGAEILVARSAASLLSTTEGHTVLLGDERSLKTRSVILATGARYRQIPLISGTPSATISIHYAATALEATRCLDEEVIVLGGGNSAGQAAVFLAKSARHVHLVIRGETLSTSMSEYLIYRIASAGNITLHTKASLFEVCEQKGSTSVCIRRERDGDFNCETRNIFVMIGADPNTEWLHGAVDLDGSGFILTGEQVHALSNFESSQPGVFAIGDVRSGSVKRVASAAGEGAAVVADVHRYLAKHPE